jgi:hypothetical protein
MVEGGRQVIHGWRSYLKRPEILQKLPFVELLTA